MIKDEGLTQQSRVALAKTRYFVLSDKGVRIYWVECVERKVKRKVKSKEQDQGVERAGKEGA